MAVLSGVQDRLDRDECQLAARLWLSGAAGNSTSQLHWCVPLHGVELTLLITGHTQQEASAVTILTARQGGPARVLSMQRSLQ
jgi:hypothetical protein